MKKSAIAFGDFFLILSARKEDTHMDLITVRDLFKNTEKYAGAEVNVGGWVRNRRGSKRSLASLS